MQRQTDGLAERAPTRVLIRRLGVSRTTLWRWMQYPDFPRPAAVGQLRLHDLAAVEAWLRARESRGVPLPPGSPRGDSPGTR